MIRKTQATRTFHLLSNAHLDPVWLWDWREGLNQGLITCRTVLDLMDEHPHLTFNRGEAAIYRHIEETDPATFERIRRYVQSGRWDFVGGTWIQPDENLPATETLVRQFTRGQRYFASRFGRRVKVAWSADCFGHSGGLPEIFAAAGIESFAFTRPAPHTLSLAKPAFWWIGPGGSRILAYRPLGPWYGTEREENPTRLDEALRHAESQGLTHVGIFYGLGDHGGGPTRRHLEDIDAWAKAHPQVRVVHSTMHRFFDELHREVRRKPPGFLPEIDHELNFFARGCYSSMARLKFMYRKAESLLSQAETTAGAIAMGLDEKTTNPLGDAWDAVLFNAFHDILPGTSIERAFDDQLAQLGMTIHQAQSAEMKAMNALAMRIDTRALPAPRPDEPTGVMALVWNPHPFAFDGFVEFEGCLDDRPIHKYRDHIDAAPLRVLDHRKKPLSFQRTVVDNSFSPEALWRARVIVPMSLPAMGWSVFELGLAEGAPRPAAPTTPARALARQNAITNGIYRIQTRLGGKGIRMTRNGKPFLGGDGLKAMLYSDPWGSWGGGKDDDLGKPIERWRVTEVVVLEDGPWRSSLWVRLAGERSRIDLTFQLYAGRDAVDVSARVHFDERSARLRLVFPVGGDAEFDSPGDRTIRRPGGEVPARRWVRLRDRSFGIATDSLYSYNLDQKQLQVTVVRATRYAESVRRESKENPAMPATDVGEFKFRFLLAPGDDRFHQLAQTFEHPPAVLLVPAKKGDLPAKGSMLSLAPHSLELLAFKPADDARGFVLRVRETAGRSTRPRLKLAGKTVPLPSIRANTIASFRIARSKTGFAVRECDAAE